METYYVRSRGKVAGPFEIEALQALVQRGKLSRFDQVSIDNKATWKAASAVQALFAAATPRRAAKAAAVATGEYDHTVADAVEIGLDDESSGGGNRGRAAAAGVQFFYAQNGAAVGPMGLEVLRTLAINGTLRGDDPVWAEGSDVATPARQVPMLASLYSGRPRGARGGSLAYAGGDAGENLPAWVRATQYHAKVVYIVAAGLTLVFSLLPVVILNGTPRWWWNGDAALAAASIYSILAATALLIVAPLVAGAARPIVGLSLIGVPTLLGFIDSIIRAADGGGTAVLAMLAVWGAIVMPILLVAVNRVRPRLADGGPISARVLQIVFGALTLLSSVAGVVLLVIAADNWIERPRPAFVVAYACTWLGVVANLAAGLLAIIVGKPRFEPGLNLTSTICLAAAGGAFLLAAVVVVAEVQTFLRGFDAGAATYAIFRVGVLFVAAVAWLSASFRELLAWSFRCAATAE